MIMSGRDPSAPLRTGARAPNERSGQARILFVRLGARREREVGVLEQALEGGNGGLGIALPALGHGLPALDVRADAGHARRARIRPDIALIDLAELGAVGEVLRRA